MIRFLKAMLIFARHFPLCAKVMPQWDDGDSAALAHFLSTPTGRKYIELIRYQEQSCNADAVMKKDRQEYACGFAAGFRANAAYFLSLSAKRTPQVAPSEDESGPDPYLETLRP